MQYTLSENDIRSFLQPAPTPAWRRLILVALAASVIAASALGAQMVLSPKTTTYATASAATPAATGTPEPSAAPATPAAPTPLPVTLPDNTFSAGELGVSAPISWNVPLEEKTMNKFLLAGVTHVEGTALPGQKGVVAIAGHSSNYPWIKSDYNTVFAPLTKAAIGQVYELNYNGVMYRYVVTQAWEVSPDDTSVLSDNSASAIHLITCVPLGTSAKRLIVRAVQTEPDPALNEDFVPAAISGQLPSGQ